MRDRIEPPELTEEQEREFEERINTREKIRNYEKCIDAIKEQVEAVEINPYERIDTIRFYIKELENV